MTFKTFRSKCGWWEAESEICLEHWFVENRFLGGDRVLRSEIIEWLDENAPGWTFIYDEGPGPLYLTLPTVAAAIHFRMVYDDQVVYQ